MLEVRAEFIDLPFDAKMGKKSEIKQEETEVDCSQYCKSEPLMERLGKLKDLKEKFQTLSFFKDKNLTFEQVEAIQELLK